MNQYLTLEDIRDQLPEKARPPIRALRERADALNIPKRRWNRQRVLTLGEAECLLHSASTDVSIKLGVQSPLDKKTVKYRLGESNKQLEKNQRLERLGLL